VRPRSRRAGVAFRDRAGARLLVDTTLRRALASVQHVWADQGYTGAFAEWLREARGWHLEVVRHPARQARRYGYEERPPYRFEVRHAGGS
jgi:hypothetical protein